MIMTVFSIVVFGAILLGVISTRSSGAMMYILGGLVLVERIILGIALKNKLEVDTQKYKTLISEILGSA